MHILIEILLIIIVAPVLEIALYAFFELFKKKKHNSVENNEHKNSQRVVDCDNFHMKYNKESKGLAAGVGVIMCCSCLSGLIPVFIGYRKDEIILSSFLVVFIILMSLLLVTVYLMLKIFFYKIKYTSGIFYKARFLKNKKIDINSLSYKTITKRQIVLYAQHKKALKLTSALTNFDIAKKICSKADVSSSINSK